MAETTDALEPLRPREALDLEDDAEDTSWLALASAPMAAHWLRDGQRRPGRTTDTDEEDF